MGDTSSTTEPFVGWPEEARATLTAVEALMVRDRMSREDVARLSGVPYGTLSQWFTGKYGGRVDNIAERVQRWLDGYMEQRNTRSALPSDPPFVETATASAFLAALRMAQAVRTMGVISGGAGVGKTMAVCHYRKSTTNVWVITARADSASMGALLEEVCGALGISERIARRRAGACIDRLRDTGGLLIVDEAQHLTTEALELLRGIHDASGVGVAVVGNETVYSKLQGTGRKAEFAQLFSRIGSRTRRSNPLRSDIDAVVAGWGVTDAKAAKLLRVIGQKPGGLRNIKMTMRLAHLMAMGDGEEGVITEDRIARAYEGISDTQADPGRGGN